MCMPAAVRASAAALIQLAPSTRAQGVFFAYSSFLSFVASCSAHLEQQVLVKVDAVIAVHVKLADEGGGLRTRAGRLGLVGWR